jgi:hypothetical protein
MINELEVTWKGAVVIEFKVLSRHVTEGIEENHENLQSE